MKIRTTFRFVWIVLGLSFLIQACQYSKEPKVFQKNGITITYPSYLEEANDVYPMPQTLFQAKNGYRDVYFILVDWGKKQGDSLFNQVCDTVIGQLKGNLKEVNKEKPDSNFTINTMKAREMQVSGILSQHDMDIRFLFDIVVFQTAHGHIYQTAGWLMRHKRHLWLKDVQKTAYSFQIK